jgi:hypothetical protein
MIRAHFKFPDGTEAKKDTPAFPLDSLRMFASICDDVMDNVIYHARVGRESHTLNQQHATEALQKVIGEDNPFFEAYQTMLDHMSDKHEKLKRKKVQLAQEQKAAAAAAAAVASADASATTGDDDSEAKKNAKPRTVRIHTQLGLYIPFTYARKVAATRTTLADSADFPLTVFINMFALEVLTIASTAAEKDGNRGVGSEYIYRAVAALPNGIISIRSPGIEDAPPPVEKKKKTKKTKKTKKVKEQEEQEEQEAQEESEEPEEPEEEPEEEQTEETEETEEAQEDDKKKPSKKVKKRVAEVKKQKPAKRRKKKQEAKLMSDSDEEIA